MSDRPIRVSLADLDETERSYPREVREDRTRLIFTRAVTIIRHFLGRDWAEDNVIQDAEGSRPDTFFRLDFSSDEARERKTSRVLDFAETLFNLQHIEGFDDCLDRMRGGQVEATFAEFDCARFLYIHDVSFRFVVPSGVKGADYDFAITYGDGRVACIDAKCRLEETEVRGETIRNSLETARRNNLPKDQPGIVFVKVPEAWLVDEGVRRTMLDVSADVLRKTGRLVSVVLYSWIVEVVPGNMLWIRHQFKEIENPVHRFDQSKSWTLFRDFVVPPEWKGMPPKWVRLFSTG